jgi:hypothetical protein
MAKGDIVEGQIGSVGSYDVEFKGGKLIAKVQAGAHGISGGAFVELDSDLVIDAITKAIPGKVDDAVAVVIKVGLKEVSG